MVRGCFPKWRRRARQFNWKLNGFTSPCEQPFSFSWIFPPAGFSSSWYWQATSDGISCLFTKGTSACNRVQYYICLNFRSTFFFLAGEIRDYLLSIGWRQYILGYLPPPIHHPGVPLLHLAHLSLHDRAFLEKIKLAWMHIYFNDQPPHIIGRLCYVILCYVMSSWSVANELYNNKLGKL